MAVTEKELGQETFAGRKMTEEEFSALPDDGRKYELVDGEVREVPTGGQHGRTGTRVIRLLGPSADEQGELFDSSTGFRMSNGNIRSPDVSMMRRERLPDDQVPVGFIEGAPDLCVEIISPSEKPSETQVKIGEYFESGASQVWHLFPEKRRLVVYRSLDNVQSYGPEETLEAGDILPGFTCRVADLFAVPTQTPA